MRDKCMMDFNKASEENLLIYGKPSRIKYTSILFPYLHSLIVSGNSFVVTDPESKILAAHGDLLLENGYRIVSINSRHVEQSNCWNPMFIPYQVFKNGEIDLCVNLLNDIATNIMSDGVTDKETDPFWTLSSIDLFVGLSLLLFQESTDIEQINVKSVYYMGLKGFDKFGSSTILKEYFERINKDFAIAAEAISTVMAAPNDTRSSILSVFSQKIRAFTGNGRFVNNLSTNGFDLDELLNYKTAFFLVYEDEKSMKIPYVNIFIRQIFEMLVKKRTSEILNYPDFHIVFTSFLSLGIFPDLDGLILSCSNRNIKLLFDISNYNLLNKLYGKYSSELIFSFCPSWVVFSTRELEMLGHIESLLKYSGADSSLVNKLPFELSENEYMFFTDGVIPDVCSINDSSAYNYTYLHKPSQTGTVNIAVFRIDEFVKEKLQHNIFNPYTNINVKNNISEPVDEMINQINRKIAALEIAEKFERAKSINTREKKD